LIDNKAMKKRRRIMLESRNYSGDDFDVACVVVEERKALT